MAVATVDDPGGNLWPLHDRNHREVQLQQQQFAVAVAELLEDARRRRRWMMAAVVCGGHLLWEVAVLLLPAPVPKRAAKRKQSGRPILFTDQSFPRCLPGGYHCTDWMCGTVAVIRASGVRSEAFVFPHTLILIFWIWSGSSLVAR